MTTSPGDKVGAKLGFDPGIEGGSIDRLVDYPWRGQFVAAQGGDKKHVPAFAHRR
jgi:hypothetical protein